MAALAIGAVGMSGAAAQALKLPNKASFKSSSATAVCVQPTPGFEPLVEEQHNLAPLTTASGTGEGFPVGEANCSTFLPHAYVLGKSGQPVGPWTGLRGASWISYTPGGASIEPAAYYIYESDFAAKCPSSVTTGKLSGLMMADNDVGAFLNGHPLAKAEENFGGPAAKFATKVAADFVPGTNKLQLVLFDYGAVTGIAFKGSASWACG